MKIKITEIEANAEELRQSNSLADGFSRILRNAFSPTDYIETEDDEGESEGEGE